eukprot:15109912-Ditylum_brightwellii.AAC.1
MAQTMHSMMAATKDVIDLENNNDSCSSLGSDMLALIQRPTKKLKNSSEVAKKKSSSFSAKKSLEGKTISYSHQYKKPVEMEDIMFFIMQQQMKHQDNNKAAREH